MKHQYFPPASFIRMSVANYSQKTENEKHERGTLNQTKCINQNSLKEGLVLLLTGVNK